MKAMPNKGKTLGICAAALAFLLMAAGSTPDNENTASTPDESSQTTAVTAGTEAAPVTEVTTAVTEAAPVETEAPATTEPEPRTEADEYYENTSEKITATAHANAENTLSEKEVTALFAERGFEEIEITYEYDLDGKAVDEAAADKASDAKHPMYQAMYQAAEGDIWAVCVVGKALYARPLSYNFESDTEIEYIFGEDDELICYADENNKLYTTVPKDTAVSYHVVEKINAEALDKLTFEEIEKL